MTYGPRCRVCGRSPEDVLTAALKMRTVKGAYFAAQFYRTRWRATLGNLRDLMCWFCSLDVARFIYERERRTA